MKKIILAVALFALALPVYADVTVNLKGSTLGAGLEAALPMTQSIDARLGFNTFKKSVKQSSTASNGATTDFNGDLQLQSVLALADWHPFEGSFRMSGGLVLNNNKFTMTALSNGTSIVVGGQTYNSPTASVTAVVDFKKIVPYLGLGWGRTPKNTGLSFTSDIGVVFQGSPNASVTTSNIPDPTGTLAADTAKASADLKDSMKSFKIYPVISFGIGYTF